MPNFEKNVLHFVHHGFKKPTKEAADLKDALEKQGVRVLVEPYDGYKHVDLGVPKARLNIEIDGIQHLTDPDQIVADLNRAHHSKKLRYDTMHIPNEMIRKHLEKIAHGLSEACKIRERTIQVHLVR